MVDPDYVMAGWMKGYWMGPASDVGHEYRSYVVFSSCRCFSYAPRAPVQKPISTQTTTCDVQGDEGVSHAIHINITEWNRLSKGQVFWAR